MKGEQRSEEYLKVNPAGTLPALVRYGSATSYAFWVSYFLCFD